MPKTLDHLLRDLRKNKCLVSSIIQVDKDEWRAAIRKAYCFSTGHGSGATLVEALSDAWERFVDGDAWSKTQTRRKPPPAAPRKRIRIKVNQE